MSLHKGDLVICLESAHLGIVIEALPNGKLKIDFNGEVVILEQEDITILRSNKNAKM